jgi:hypothetical protein
MQWHSNRKARVCQALALKPQTGKGNRMNLDPHEEESIIGSVWLVLIVLILWIIYGGTA